MTLFDNSKLFCVPKVERVSDSEVKPEVHDTACTILVLLRQLYPSNSSQDLTDQGAHDREASGLECYRPIGESCRSTFLNSPDKAVEAAAGNVTICESSRALTELKLAIPKASVSQKFLRMPVSKFY